MCTSLQKPTEAEIIYKKVCLESVSQVVQAEFSAERNIHK